MVGTEVVSVVVRHWLFSDVAGFDLDSPNVINA